MKYFNLILGISILLAGCNNREAGSDAYGNFEADPVIISSEATGKLLNLTIEKGQNIDSGTVVGVIDSTQLYLNKQQLVAQKGSVLAKRTGIKTQVDVFEQQKANLMTDKVRIEQMLADGAATQNQLDQVVGQIKVLDRQIENVQAQYSLINQEMEVLEAKITASEDLLNKSVLVSPIKGTIMEVYLKSGELASTGKPIYKITSLDPLILKVYISGAQLSAVKLGQKVQVLIDKNDAELQPFNGEVIWISPEAEFTPKIIQTREERVNLVYAVKLKVQNDGSLKIGMPAEVKFL